MDAWFRIQLLLDPVGAKEPRANASVLATSRYYAQLLQRQAGLRRVAGPVFPRRTRPLIGWRLTSTEDER